MNPQEETTTQTQLTDKLDSPSFISRKDWIAIRTSDVQGVVKALDLGGTISCTPEKGIAAVAMGHFCYVTSVPGWVLIFQHVSYAEVEDEDTNELLQKLSADFGEAQWFHCEGEKQRYHAEKYENGKLVHWEAFEEQSSWQSMVQQWTQVGSSPLEERVLEIAKQGSVDPGLIFQQPAGLVGIRHFRSWKRNIQQTVQQNYERKASQSAYIAVGFFIPAILSFIYSFSDFSYIRDRYLASTFEIKATLFLIGFIFLITSITFGIVSRVMSGKADKRNVSKLSTVETLLPK